VWKCLVVRLVAEEAEEAVVVAEEEAAAVALDVDSGGGDFLLYFILDIVNLKSRCDVSTAENSSLSTPH